MHSKQEGLVGNHQILHYVIKCYHYVLEVQLALEVPELLNLPFLLSYQLDLGVHHDHLYHLFHLFR